MPNLQDRGPTWCRKVSLTLAAFLACASLHGQTLHQRIGEFLGKCDFPPIVQDEKARLTSEVTTRWAAWREEHLLTPARDYLTKNHPEQAKEWMEVVEAFALERMRHPEQSSDQTFQTLNVVRLIGLAQAMLEKEPTEPLVALSMSHFLRFARSPTAMQSVPAVSDEAVKRVTSPIARFLCERARDYGVPTGTPRNGKLPVPARLAAALAAFKEGPPLSDAEAEMFHGFLEELVTSTNCTNHPDTVLSLAKGSRLPEWLSLTLQGEFLILKAWAIRGNDWAHKVGPAQMEGFVIELKNAREVLTKAWKLKPDMPFAAKEMITVCKGLGDMDGESARDWFDRATAARFDYLEAYAALTGYLLPRWMGSLEKMVALALACVDTDRYDTPVPRQSLRIVESVVKEARGEWQRLYSDPLLADAIVAMCEGYVAHASTPADKHKDLCSLAVMAWLLNQRDKTVEALAAIKEPFSVAAIFDLDRHGMTERQLREEADIQSLGLLPDYERARALYGKRDLDEAEPVLQKIKAARPGAAPAPVSRLLAAIEFEREFDKGGWVRMKIGPGLENWQAIGGKWTATKDGALEVEGPQSKCMILFNGRTGAEVEIRGEYVLTMKDPVFTGLCVVACHSHAGRSAETLGCSGGFIPSKSIMQGWLTNEAFGFGGPDRVALKDVTSLPEKMRFLIKLSSGKTSYTLNDQVIAADTVFMVQSPRTVPLTLSDSGQAGFSWYTVLAGCKARVLFIEARKLGVR